MFSEKDSVWLSKGRDLNFSIPFTEFLLMDLMDAAKRVLSREQSMSALYIGERNALDSV